MYFFKRLRFFVDGDGEQTDGTVYEFFDDGMHDCFVHVVEAQTIDA